MEARSIYYTMRGIAEPIHGYADQIAAIAKWVESEFNYNPQKKAKDVNLRLVSIKDKIDILKSQLLISSISETNSIILNLIGDIQYLSSK